MDGVETEGWDNDIETEAAPDHPTPMYWRVLVMPVRPRKVSKGGILIAEEARNNADFLNFIGKIVATGPLAFMSESYKGIDSNELPKVGEFVIYGRYAGQPLEHRGVKLLFINDDEILGRVPDPESIKVYL